ncbi:efflux transporter outer membrane subunit [Azoarcus sp. DN11]|uniref:efflux transporter outer membrane subunit n=1 Tax=Azoarcus sp. DN11 TaxID=356837 RepID=UPI001C2B9EA0|nr:efflux transporter outer membrane subunit [Azoarcus sp. DN11]
MAGGDAQHFVFGRDIPAEWWRLFQSPQLDTLIRQAFKANPTIEAAQAALRQAQENVYAQQGFFYPTVQANYSPSRIKLSGNTGGNSPGLQGDGSVIATGQTDTVPPASTPVIYNWHSAQLTVGYVPDVFGGNRRQVESLEAQRQAQRLQLEATYLTLASNVAAAAIQEASLREQIAAVNHIIATNTQSLDILQQQFRLGYAMRLDVAAQEAALAQARQLLPPLQKQLAQTRDLIRALAGKLPSEEVAETFTLAALHLPTELPLSLPSDLVVQRPDIRAAEEQLHSASAQVGVALAARLPQFSINAIAGGNAARFGDMFMDSGKFFSIVGNVTQTLFDGGTLRHRQLAAEEALAQAKAQYRGTVLTAFQNVADTLHALHVDADALKAAVESERAAQITLDLIRKQQELGYVNYLALLNAEQSYQLAAITLVQAQAARYGDTAALFQALGGGWWNRKPAEGDKLASDTRLSSQ